MPRVCTICSHAERETIDRELVSGQRSLRDIAGQFGTKKSALPRHKHDHLPAAMVKGQEAREVARAGSLLDQVRNL